MARLGYHGQAAVAEKLGIAREEIGPLLPTPNVATVVPPTEEEAKSFDGLVAGLFLVALRDQRVRTEIRSILLSGS